MEKKICLQEYTNALMAVAKRASEKVKINNAERTITLADEGVSFSYWDDNGEMGMTQIELRCGDPKNREEFLWLHWSNSGVYSNSPYSNYLGDNLSLKDILGEQVFDTLASDIKSPILEITDLFDQSKSSSLMKATPDVCKKLRKFLEKYPEFDISRDRSKTHSGERNLSMEGIGSELEEISREGLVAETQSGLIALAQEQDVQKGLEEQGE